MTADAVKNCGSCRWWEARQFGRIKRGDCLAPIPKSLSRFGFTPTLPTEGTDCPCYAAREAAE